MCSFANGNDCGDFDASAFGSSLFDSAPPDLFKANRFFSIQVHSVLGSMHSFGIGFYCVLAKSAAVAQHRSSDKDNERLIDAEHLAAQVHLEVSDNTHLRFHLPSSTLAAASHTPANTCTFRCWQIIVSYPWHGLRRQHG